MPKYDYEYYSGAESEQFRFLKIPKIFFEDSDYEELGLAECVLYGFLHEQVAFSRQNGWVDETGKTYVIRSLESIQKLLHGCSADKARSTLKNLIDFGLIEKKRRGQGKPDIIYVKNFVTKKSEISSSGKTAGCGKNISETGKNDVLNDEKPISKDGNFRVLEAGISAPIDTNNNLKNIIEPNHNLIQVTGNTTGASEAVDNSGLDEDAIREDIEQIKRNIYYDEMSARYRAEFNSRFDELFEVMIDLIAGKRESLNIGGTEYPQWLIRKRIMSLTASHVEYVMGMIAENIGKIHNMRKYMIAALFNAPTTMDNYFTQLVNHDMHSEKWFEMLEKRKGENEAGFKMQVQEADARQSGIEFKTGQDGFRRAANEW